MGIRILVRWHLYIETPFLYWGSPIIGSVVFTMLTINVYTTSNINKFYNTFMHTSSDHMKLHSLCKIRTSVYTAEVNLVHIHMKKLFFFQIIYNIKNLSHNDDLSYHTAWISDIVKNLKKVMLCLLISICYEFPTRYTELFNDQI